MSDLAPFVAAVIRDRIVEDLQSENEAQRKEIERLRRTIHERNPRRSVQITGPKGKEIYMSSTLHLSFAQQSRTTKFPFLNRGRQPQREEEHVFECRFRKFPRYELWIDGGRALHFKDLSYHYLGYIYVVEGEERNYVGQFFVRDGRNFEIGFLMLLPPDDHAKLLNRDNPMEFVGPTVDGQHHYMIDGPVDTEIPLSQIVEVCGENEGAIAWNLGACTGEWFFQKLVVPYAPVEDD